MFIKCIKYLINNDLTILQIVSMLLFENYF